jgi:hypothetical protein
MVRHRQATEEDLAKLPALLIGFGPRPQPEPSEEDDDRSCDDEER